MAKPFLDRAGNGFHVHFSLLDPEGRNVFDNGTADGSEMMRHAVGVAGADAGLEPDLRAASQHATGG